MSLGHGSGAEGFRYYLLEIEQRGLKRSAAPPGREIADMSTGNRAYWASRSSMAFASTGQRIARAYDIRLDATCLQSLRRIGPGTAMRYVSTGHCVAHA
eukprot:2246712-Rhodomonas_salina.4